MKDNSAFLDSVFEKSEKIFEKRKKRRKITISLLSTSACFLLVIGIFNSLPLAKKAFDAEMAPTDNYYSDKVDNGSIKEEAAGDGNLKDSVTIYEKEIASLDEIPPFEQRMPKSISVTEFSSIVTLYKAEEDFLKIKEALDAYFTSVHDANATGKVTFYYEGEKLTIYVGNEFFELYNQ
jgi:hypothetical protein